MAELQFVHCRKCKYELTGLARVGACPECGQRYNLNTGWGTLENADPTVETQIKIQKFKVVALCWITGVLLLVCIAFILAGRSYIGEIGLFVVFVFLLVTISALIDHRELLTKGQDTMEHDEELLAGPLSKKKQRPSEKPPSKS